MACSDEILTIACETLPDQVTLVPEKRQELTTEGGLDVVGNRDAVARAIDRLNKAGIDVALFIDPALDQVKVSAELGAKAVEFHTGTYAEAKGREAIELQLDILRRACTAAVERSLHVHLGHGLNYLNVKQVVRILGVEELNIGHSIISRAVFVGLERAVREMKEAMQEHYPNAKK
jgi:pyridoxine 5-phosphate synthase